MTQGTYTVRLEDPNFATRCAWDTTFSVDANKLIAIDNIFGSTTFCYDSTANVGVTMVNQTQNYEFAWNNNPYGDDSLQFNLPAGTYPVKIRDSILGCEIDTVVAVTSAPFPLTVRIENEECNDSTGKIILENIIPKMTVFWLDNGSSETVRDNLKSGNYSLQITTGIVGCSLDTTLKINLTIPEYSRLYASFDRAFFIKNYQSVCQQDSVTFHVWEDGQDHYNDFFWHYEWYRGDTLTTPIAQDTMTVTLAPNNGEKIYVKSFLRSNQNCFLTDSWR